MNERIKELAEQAWDATAVSPDFGHPVSFAEKLSELIVRECSIAIQDFVDHRIPASEYPNRLKEHFGIKKIIDVL